MENEYSPEFAKEILEKFNEKGWNFYRRDENSNISAYERIRNNLSDSLELNGKYVLLPVADDPRDPDKVMNALEILARKLNGKMPTIRLNYSNYPLTGLTLEKNFVELHTPEGNHVSYPDLMEAIDSVVKTN